MSTFSLSMVSEVDKANISCKFAVLMVEGSGLVLEFRSSILFEIKVIETDAAIRWLNFVEVEFWFMN